MSHETALGRNPPTSSRSAQVRGVLRLPRAWRAGAIAAAGMIGALLLMGSTRQLRWGVPLGAALVAVASIGFLDLLSALTRIREGVTRSVDVRALVTPVGAMLLAWGSFALALGLAQSGYALPQRLWGVVIAITFVGGVAASYGLGQRLGLWPSAGEPRWRPLWKRHGFWLLLLAAGLYFPCMGTSSLTDPWETQYGEVAREMLARNDWISLWWAHENWFWSKPVLDMWMQAIAMATLGVHYRPDQMLVGDGTQPLMHPEWVVRAPIVLLAALALYVFYKGVARAFGRRAALLGSVVLATTPLWCFITHQTMTDMPLVGCMTACMGLVLLGMATPEDVEVGVAEVRLGRWRLHLSARHAVLGAILMCALPQIVYLVSRNVEPIWEPGAHGLHAHWDVFRSGSGGGNCGLPGSEACKDTLPALNFEPALQALVWTSMLGVLLYIKRDERRAKSLYYLGAWLFAALATLGKGPAGFGLPMLVTFVCLCASRPREGVAARIARVAREIAQFEIFSGALIVAAVALPWYVAMVVRHGSPFTDRLIFHDMISRLMTQMEDKDVGDDTSFRYYIWQLGYAMFPWTGLVPLAVAWWARRNGVDPGGHRSDARLLLFLWFLFAFSLFTFMGTKFHYYIFPAIPPLAMLVGLLLDDILRSRMARDGHVSRVLAGGAVAGALLLVLVARDLVVRPQGSDQPGEIRLMQLFTYNYRRPWPENLDFQATLAVFSVLAVLLCLALAVRVARRWAVAAMCLLGVAWAGWSLDVYLQKTAQHWGQRELLEAYYTDRGSPDEMLVAYQMNWKGENFYTGNRLAVFVSSGAPFTQWLAKRREAGEKVFYFVTEWGRLGGLKNEVGAKSYRELTDRSVCNKFVMVRAEL
jgi:4-amino-4-deoxy-L-arabinose transferase-like glycosyltransferase